MLEPLKRVLSFQFDDHPMADWVYDLHGYWIQLLHDYYFRVKHLGSVKECLQAAQKQHAIFISNHALTLEATLIGYYLLKNGAGKMGTLVYREAFKLPLVREFFRSCQCVPISIEAGATALRFRHILLFPEGLDFLRGLEDPDRTAPFHTGFLRMARSYMKQTGRKEVSVIPIAHSGVEKSFKFWTVENDFLLNTFIRPFAKYPFWIVPKFPFLLPAKVVMNWGRPVQLTARDLQTEAKVEKQSARFHDLICAMRKEAEEVREKEKFLF